DWLMRFYGFEVGEVAPPGNDGMLDLDIDPKLAWALRNRAQFPVELDTAPREQLLRVPGLGVKTVRRLLAIRRHRRLRYADLVKLGVSMAKVAPFVAMVDHRPRAEAEGAVLRAAVAPPPKQPDLFGHCW